MLLAIDAGNTNIVFAVYRGSEQLQLWRFATDARRTADEYAALLTPLFQQAGLLFKGISDVVLCSVVPDATFHLAQLCRGYFSCEPLTVNHDSIDLPVRLARPQEAGADRLVNAVAVKAFYSFPAVVIDFGTATTFDVVDASGAFCGGVIAPGVNLSLAALHQAAAKLPKISFQRPQTVIGADTVSAMQSGVFWGYVSLIEGMIARIQSEMGVKPFIVTTGGLSTLFGNGLSGVDAVDPDLTLRGLVYIYETRRQNLKAA